MHGLDPLKMGAGLARLPRYIRDYRRYRATRHPDFPLHFSAIMPVLSDYTDQAGVLKGHYVHQDLWAATKILRAAPPRHVDIGSRIDGFITALIAHRPVEVVDIRPLTSPYDNLVFIQDNACTMKQFQDNELESVSCLHAMEHFGLGRYGDPIEPDAYKIFARALTRVIRPGGVLYLSVPIGRQRLMFNAHRVFAPQTIIKLFPHFTLKSFAAVNDDGDFIAQTVPEDFNESRFACGLFEFHKKVEQ